MEKAFRCSVDRREGDLLVLVPDEGEEEFTIPAEGFAGKIHDVVDAVVSDGKVTSVSIVPGEGEARAKRNADRLHALFSKRK